jgi:hypothetical protein
MFNKLKYHILIVCTVYFVCCYNELNNTPIERRECALKGDTLSVL